MEDDKEKVYENRRDVLFDLSSIVSDLEGAINAYTQNYNRLNAIISVVKVLDEKEINPISLKIAIEGHKATKLYKKCKELSDLLDKLPKDEELAVLETDTGIRYHVLKEQFEYVKWNVECMEKDISKDTRARTATIRLPTSYKEPELEEALKMVEVPA
jgi:hypothetical protein